MNFKVSYELRWSVMMHNVQKKGKIVEILEREKGKIMER